MDKIEKISRDFALIKDIALEAAFDSGIDPVRCHEMARLINAGMRMTGYQSKVKDGIRFLEGIHMKHSWVEIPGSFGMLNGMLLDFSFGNFRSLRYPRSGHSEIISGWFNLRRYKHKRISYELSPGVDD